MQLPVIFEAFRLVFRVVSHSWIVSNLFENVRYDFSSLYFLRLDSLAEISAFEISFKLRDSI